MFCLKTPSLLFSNTVTPPAKNSTDSAMIIDAMDILYSETGKRISASFQATAILPALPPACAKQE
jgi:hypothetical protein